MKTPNSPKPHLKFIAVILALSIGVTGFSTAPARAGDDVGKFIAGAVVLGLVGAAINEARKDEKRRHKPQTHYHNNHNNGHRPRPLPAPVARYDLPSQCVKIVPQYSHSRTVVSHRCLKRNYGHVQSLPSKCGISVRAGDRHRKAYKTRCLQNHGYRLVSR